jgi:hypothetical protein
MVNIKHFISCAHLKLFTKELLHVKISHIAHETNAPTVVYERILNVFEIVFEGIVAMPHAIVLHLYDPPTASEIIALKVYPFIS